MADDASVRMTVDSAPAITETQKYVRQATEAFNILLQKSEKYSNDIKLRTQFIEREIALMRERNKLEMGENIRTEQTLYARGATTAKERAAGMADIHYAAQVDESKISELVKLTKQWTNDQKVEAEKANRLGQTFTRMLPGIINAGSAEGMISGATGGLLAPLGFMGAIAGILISKAVRGASTMEPAMRDYAILTGQTLIGTQGEVGKLDVSAKTGLASLGMRPSEYYINKAQLLRAGGGVMNEDALGIMASEKALGLSRQTTAGLLGVERYGGGTITNIEHYFERYLRETGQKIAVLSESLQGYTTEASRMLRITGRVDPEAIAAAITTVSKGFGIKGEPLQNIFAAMNQGLQQSSNPVIQAMQYSAMSRAMPGASLWKMQTAMENPMENPQYVANMMDLARKTSAGGQEGYARNLMNLLGISANQADLLANGKYSPETFAADKAAFRKTGVGGDEKRAADLMGALEKASAAWAGGFEKRGFAGGTEQFVTELTTALDGIGGKIDKLNDDLNSREVDLTMNMVNANTYLKKMLAVFEFGFFKSLTFHP
jgi:hypothetical protein